MVLTPNDVGILVEHTVWRRGKVIEILSPYAIIHFPALANSPQGPQRKLREDAPQLTKSSVQSDPELDAIETGPGEAEEDQQAQGQGPAERPRRGGAVVRGRPIPAKFEDEKFVDDDLRNKRAAAGRVPRQLRRGPRRGDGRRGQARRDRRALDGIFRATNILSPFEVKAVHKAFVKADEAVDARCSAPRSRSSPTRASRRSRRWPKR